jgi:hypothetical protein
VKHVGGYVTVSNSPRLETLEFLENLTSIGGRNLWALGTEEFYGLVIRNNRNLRSVYWKQQQKLWLGGRTDVQVLITSNYMACEDGIKKLKLPFPFSVAIYDNGILAVCNPGSLNLSTTKNQSHITYLQWDPVPLANQTEENRTIFIGYQIFWQVTHSVSVTKSVPDPFPKEYDENNLEICGNTRWRSLSVGNVTSYRLTEDMLPAWTTTVFQVRAEFSRRGIGFKSGMLRVNGTSTDDMDRVSNLSATVSPGLTPSTANVTISWKRPEYPNGEYAYYEVRIESFSFMPQQEQKDFQHSHSQLVLPSMKILGCNYTSGHHQSYYFCKFHSRETNVSLNLTLMRAAGRKLHYHVVVRAASSQSKLTDKTPKAEIEFAVSEAPRNQDRNSNILNPVIGVVMVVCLVLVIVVLLYVLWRQKRNKRALAHATSHMYAYLDRALDNGEYLADEWEIARDEVVLNKELGRGAFGLVYQGTWQSRDDDQPQDVAVKASN